MSPTTRVSGVKNSQVKGAETMADKYELFADPAQCNVALPVNQIKDEFTFIRFTPLRLFDGTRHGPVVLPRDVVNPMVVDALRRSLPYTVEPPAIKGGFALDPSWSTPVDPPPDDVLKVNKFQIGSLSQFLANPKVVVDGNKVTPELSPNNIQELLHQGTTVVGVRIGEGRVAVQITTGPDVQQDLTETSAHAVGSLYEFLSAPMVQIDTGAAYPATLTQRNVHELMTTGVSRVEVQTQTAPMEVYVSLSSVGAAGPNAGVASSASAMMMRNGIAMADPAHAMSAVSTKAGNDLLERVASELVPRLDFALYLPYRQTWHLLGYSRGELLNTISLAPQEETTIEINTWDRTTQTRDDSLSSEREGTLEVSFSDKDSAALVKESTKDSNWKFGLSGKVEVPKIPVNIGADYSTGESLKDITKDTQEKVSEAVRKGSARVKTSRQTKVTESHEFGREDRVTRKLKNSNLCRTLNLDCFEIVATYEVTTELVTTGIRLCLLTPIAGISRVDRHFLLANEGLMRPALLSKDVYAKGFEAARLLWAWERSCEVDCRTCECTKPDMPPPPPPPPQTQSTTGSAPAAELTVASQNLRAKIGILLAASPTPICNLANDIDRWLRANGIPTFQGPAMTKTQKEAYEAEWTSAKITYHQWLYRKLAMETLSVKFWDACVSFANAKQDTQQAVEEVVAAASFNALTDILNMALSQIKLTSKLPALLSELLGAQCKVVSPLITNADLSDAGLDPAFKRAKQALEAVKAPPPTDTKTATDQASGKAAEPAKTAAQASPDFLPGDIAIAMADEEALISHVQQNLSYYRRAIWDRMTPDDRLRFLSAYGDLEQYVEGDVLGFAGDQAALPFRIREFPGVDKWFKEQIQQSAGLATTPTKFTTTIPTRGVVMESRLGSCDACEEFVVKHRELDLLQKAAEVDEAAELAKQAKYETERFGKRLDKDLLDDPRADVNATNPIHIALKQE